jgi:hypothetical protein
MRNMGAYVGGGVTGGIMVSPVGTGTGGLGGMDMLYAKRRSKYCTSSWWWCDDE